MRFSSVLTLAAVTALATAPAFAADLTGFRVNKPAPSPCKIEISRVYQDAAGALHVGLHNLSTDLSAGKLVAATKVGTNMVMDGTDFSLTGGNYKEYVASKNPRGTLKGADISFSFQTCTVAMH